MHVYIYVHVDIDTYMYIRIDSNIVLNSTNECQGVSIVSLSLSACAYVLVCVHVVCKCVQL